jgi:hypothetical protein
MYRCRRWIDPARGHKHQHGKQPDQHHTEAKP